MKNEYIKKFYKEIEEKLEGDYKIILEPGRDLREKWIEYDKVEWKLETEIEKLVKVLLQRKELNFEEKLLEIYKFICLNYIYDDNVLYFFKRDDSNPENIKYIAVDWYARIVGESWFENRQNHNRRVCYEFARFYAKAINIILGKDEKLEACMVGDVENTHYVVGLTGEDYSAILDLDNFNSVKDLTRLKLGLTLKGIKILRDDKGKLEEAVKKFNNDRKEELKEVEEIIIKWQKKDTIRYFEEIVNTLRNQNLDSQGFLEYMRAKIEGEKIEVEKIWKEVKGGKEKRYVRCLLFEFNGKTYLLDSIEQTLTNIQKDELDKKIFVFNPRENEYPYYGG